MRGLLLINAAVGILAVIGTTAMYRQGFGGRGLIAFSVVCTLAALAGARRISRLERAVAAHAADTQTA